MSSLPTQIIDFLSSDTFSTAKIAVLGYFALLWLTIIIWVTRDALQRSSSIIFQAFSILLNIAIPILGVLLYLIIRPSQTRNERYYEELERNMLESENVTEQSTCSKCLTACDKDYKFCPNCGEHLKRSCQKCKKSFPDVWHICPFCGKQQEEKKAKKHSKKSSDS